MIIAARGFVCTYKTRERDACDRTYKDTYQAYMKTYI
jgi:hypothetical protein